MEAARCLVYGWTGCLAMSAMFQNRAWLFSILDPEPCQDRNGRRAYAGKEFLDGIKLLTLIPRSFRCDAPQCAKISKSHLAVIA